MNDLKESFRAKRIDTGEWVYGLPHLEYGENAKHELYEKWYIRRWDKAKDKYAPSGERFMSSSYQVNKDTLENLIV